MLNLIKTFGSSNILEKKFQQILLKYKEKDRIYIKRAYYLAKERHKNQLRDEGSPYFNHCLGVALLTMEAKNPSYIACAAFLHDTLEDTDLSEVEIANKFDQKTAKLVRDVSKIINGRKISSNEYFSNIAKNPEAIELKGYDRMANLLTLLASPDLKKREKYLIETEKKIIPLVINKNYKLAKKLKDIVEFIKKN